MKVTVSPPRWADLKADALILGVPGKGTALAGPLGEAEAAMGGPIAVTLAGRTFAGKPDETEVLFPVKGAGATRVALVGLGTEALDAERWREAVSSGLRAIAGKASRVALLLPANLDAALAAEAAAEAGVLTAYEFHPYRTKPEPDAIRFEELVLLTDHADAAAASARGSALAEAVCWVRDLANTPGNMLDVPRLVEQATRLADSHGIAVRVIEAAALESEGFGCLSAVGRASATPPALVVLEYHGGAKGDPPIVLVGKGITFDTGGICIKPRAGMEEMKTDMHGTATVLGTLRAAAERKLPLNLVGLCPIAENMPGGNAYLPGDIVTAYNGLTVEVLDTDAEGRLILADALAYGAKHYQPKAMIDLATLTGSIIVALAYEASGLFTTHTELGRALMASGEVTGERLWPMPMWDVYAANVESDLADLRNMGKGKGDAINAAMFLKHFAGQVPWVHLDIAGPSWLSAEKPYRPKGATGVGVRLLIHWLEAGAPIDRA